MIVVVHLNNCFVSRSGPFRSPFVVLKLIRLVAPFLVAAGGSSFWGT